MKLFRRKKALKKEDQIINEKEEDTCRWDLGSNGKFKMTLEEATQYIIDNPPPYD